MAKILRSAKSGNEWVASDLESYNIHIADQDVTTFFGMPALPATTVSATILDNLEMPDGNLTRNEENFFKLLEDANYTSAFESAVVDFARFLFEMMGFDAGRTRRVHTRKELSLQMCGKTVSAQTDVAVIEKVGDSSRYVLLVQEDKRYLLRHEEAEPEPQLIAEALAAYSENNLTRARADLPPILAHTFPAVIMIGSAPVFYKVPVTRELSDAVSQGAYPRHPTQVQRFQPAVDDLINYGAQGMEPLSNRRLIFQCYEALKHLVVSIP